MHASTRQIGTETPRTAVKHDLLIARRVAWRYTPRPPLISYGAHVLIDFLTSPPTTTTTHFSRTPPPPPIPPTPSSSSESSSSLISTSVSLLLSSLAGFAQVDSARELLLISTEQEPPLPSLRTNPPPPHPVPLSPSIMRKSSPPTAKKPSPTATPFIPASPNDTIPSSSSEYAGSTRLAALARVNLPPGQITCKFYVKGYCSRGTGCWYIHDAATVPVPMIVEEGGRKKVVEFREPKGKGKAACPIGQEAGIGESSLSLQRLGGRCSVSGLHTREITV